MNCHRARQLISPYLDGRLTGQEMLALQDHFAVCLSCESERQSLRQVKMLLRGLGTPHPRRDFSQGITLRLEQSEAGPQWRALGLISFSLPPVKPQRGRRLASALALSCLTVLSVVAPFAPDAGQPGRSSASLLGSRFDVPASSDILLSGAPASNRVLEPTVFVPASDGSLEPRSGVMTLTSLDTSMPAVSTSSSFGAQIRVQDTSFGGSQFALFRSR